MYEITVQTEFCAAHAIRIQGDVETVHGHNWVLTVTLGGPRLDEDGLLLDFHLVERHLGEITGRWQNRHLNDEAPFRDGVNPSAENICRVVAGELTERLQGQLPAGTAVRSVRITEAPGCFATYYPQALAAGPGMAIVD